MRYDMAIVTAKTLRQAVALFFFAIILSAGFSFLLGIIIFIFHTPIVDFLNFDIAYQNWLYAIPASVFLFISFQAINYLLIREKKFTASAINKITRRSVEAIIQLVFGLFKKNQGLLLGEIFGHFANFFAGLYQSRNVLRTNLVSWKKIRNTALRFSDFPKYNAIPALFNTASLALPLIFVNKLFSSEIAGFYDLSLKMIAVPFALITASVSQVFLQKASEKYNKKISLFKDLIQIAVALAAVAGIGLVIIEFWGVDLFVLFFWYCRTAEASS